MEEPEQEQAPNQVPNQAPKSSRGRLPFGIAVGLSALLVASGTAVWWTTQNATVENPDRVSTPLTSPTVQPRQPQAAKTSQQNSVQVYWLREDASQKIELAPNKLALKSAEPDVALRDAFSRLLAGPIAPTTVSTIPQGTELRSLSLKDDGIHIDLSKNFVSGGGSTSMTSRVAQVLYTATSLEPNAKVWISVEGKPLDTLGGEGLMLEQPLTRTAFERDFDL